MKAAVLIVRLVFGAWMLAHGVDHFFVDFLPAPAPAEPLAVQLLEAVTASRLLDVVMAMQLVGGALILAGVAVPAALYAMIPLNACAIYWAVVLEHEPVGAVLALAAFALNGLLMLAYVDAYGRLLRRRAPVAGEADGRTTFEAAYIDPRHRTARRAFIPALTALVAAGAFYFTAVPDIIGQWCILVLILPFAALHAGRLNDMGRPGWLALLPAALLLAAFWPRLFADNAALDAALTYAAAALAAAFALWGITGRSRAGAKESRAPAAAG